MNSKNIGLGQARVYWDKKAQSATTNCEAVEQSLRAQRMRFEVFILNHDLQGKSILDIGCGMADLWDQLRRHSISCEYTGFDLSDEMIQRCRKRYPNLPFESGDFLQWKPARKYDYTVAIGIHNIRVENGWSLLKKTCRKQYELCNIAAHISLLTDRYSGYAPHIQAWKAESVLSMALKITPYVVLRHDYLPNDFSITMYKQPLIDTCHNLQLD